MASAICGAERNPPGVKTTALITAARGCEQTLTPAARRTSPHPRPSQKAESSVHLTSRECLLGAPPRGGEDSGRPRKAIIKCNKETLGQIFNACWERRRADHPPAGSGDGAKEVPEQARRAEGMVEVEEVEERASSRSSHTGHLPVSLCWWGGEAEKVGTVCCPSY